MGRWIILQIILASVFVAGSFFIARPVQAQYYTCPDVPGQYCSPESCASLGDCSGSGSCAVGWSCCAPCPTPVPCVPNGSCWYPGDVCCSGDSYFDTSCVPTDTRCGNAPTPTPTYTPTPTPTPHPQDCYCTAGSCSDPEPGDNISFCYSDRDDGTCGTSGCAITEEPLTTYCQKAAYATTLDPKYRIKCNTRCVYQTWCDTGYCTGDGCINVTDSDSLIPPGPSYFCGDSGCSACERQVGITYCWCSPGDPLSGLCTCSYTCEFDESCGAGCGDGGGGPTPTPTPTTGPGIPTPTPVPVCTTPTNNVASSSCSSQTIYDVTWNFAEVAGATEYHLVVSTATGIDFWTNVVYDSDWQSSAFFSCGGGNCSLAMTGFTSGTTYYSRVQARGGTCTTSNWSSEQSAYQDCYVACPAPTLSASGSVCDTGDTLIDIAWQWNDLGAGGAASYRLQVDASPADWAGMAYNLVLTPGVNLTCNGVTCSHTTTNLAPGTWNARVKVETDNGIGCTVVPTAWSTTASRTDACLTQVIGQVFNDPFGEALPVGVGGMCSLLGASGVQPGAGSSVTVNPGGYVDPNINLDGTFAVPEIPPNIPPGAGYTSTLTPTGDWACTCPSTCLYSVDVPQDIPPDEPLAYFVSEIQGGWFQTVGGDVHARNNILSSIPATCSGSCVPEFSLAGTDEVGVVSSQSGGTNYGAGTVSSESWEATTAYNGPQYLFTFWRKESPTPTALADLDGRPSPPQGIYEITSSGDISLTGDWTNLPNDLTIFVNFSDSSYTLTLNPDPPGITVNPGALLTLITNGNIAVAEGVTTLEGIYLVDRVFRTCGIGDDDCGYDIDTGTSYPLQTRGSVIAWGGFSLQRDIFVDNRNTPAEQFIYEPEFIPRLPEFMLRAIYTWQEVAP